MIPTKASPLQWNETLTRGWYEVAPFWMLHHPQSIVTGSWTVLLVPPVIISSLFWSLFKRTEEVTMLLVSKILIVLTSYSPRIPGTFFVSVCRGGTGAVRVNLVNLNLIVAMSNVLCHIFKKWSKSRAPLEAQNQPRLLENTSSFTIWWWEDSLALA